MGRIPRRLWYGKPSRPSAAENGHAAMA